MRKRVAKGLLAAVVLSHNILGLTNVANAMIHTTETSTGLLKSKENKTENQEQDNSITTSKESYTYDAIIESELENHSATFTPQIVSSDSISPSTEVNVSNESELRNALYSGDKKIILMQDITLSEPLLIDQNNIVIDGNDNKIILNDSSQKESGNRFVIKKSDTSSLGKVENVVVKNVTFKGYYLNAISLLSLIHI